MDSPDPTQFSIVVVHVSNDEVRADNLERNVVLPGKAVRWHRCNISNSEDWKSSCTQGIQDSRLVLLLVSNDFVPTGYLDGVEFDAALSLHQSHRARLAAIRVEALNESSEKRIDSVDLTVLPSNAWPIESSEWPATADAYANISAGLQAAIKDIDDKTVPEPTLIVTAEFESPVAKTEDETPPSSPASSPSSSTLSGETIGRYQVIRELGKGSFGTVYLAHDPNFERQVAIKVCNPGRITDRHSQLLQQEAKNASRLYHPHIVKVYDVGEDECHTDNSIDNERRVFVVFEYIDGMSLESKMGESWAFLDVAVLIGKIAEALQHAHEQGLYHRDIKPANIMLGADGEPYVADFGLALAVDDVATGAEFAGTPAYMSPEQVRGSHQVEGRSDIFSLGAVLYELLTRHRPFEAKTKSQLLKQIVNTDVRPPRQWTPEIPKVLERVCLKAMARKKMDRYTTAADLADDLAAYVQNPSLVPDGSSVGSVRSSSRRRSGSSRGSRQWKSGSSASRWSPDSSSRDSIRGPSSTHHRDAISTHGKGEDTLVEHSRVEPKGLSHFGTEDAGFFLDLLPGTRDGENLPKCISFWKRKIETTDPSRTFRVGVLYGPSGGGKTSLLHAGILPRLHENVVVISFAAKPNSNAAELRTKLNELFGDDCSNESLPTTLERIRRGDYLNEDKKLLIVMDQFEQALHDKVETDDDRELIEALHQCDGIRTQCLLGIRADFFLDIDEFMRQLEIPIKVDTNALPVELFSQSHAQNVLIKFGRGYKCLPKDPSDAQLAFVRRAVESLANQEGKVIALKLAMFAQMVKDKPWDVSTIDADALSEISKQFLNGLFIADTAPPSHRKHFDAVCQVLKKLLPPAGVDIRSRRTSRQDLLEASGYAGRPDDFEELLRILDQETRLVSPTDGKTPPKRSGTVGG